MENFIGFEDNEEIKAADDDQDANMEETENLLGYREHLELPELLIGIKEGRFFQGRLNVSRLTLDEATVAVRGLYQDLLIQSLEH